MSFLKHEWKKLVGIVAVFLACFYLPIGWPRFDSAVFESLYLIKWYAREHVLLCLVPAFFIAGAISVFLSQASIMKYLGARAPKVLAYGVASISGTILAVCSCTVLPLFAGIYRMGAGLGPACAFLYSGPAINILAIILTARILGLELGIARAVGAILFSILIGLIMHVLYRKEELQKADEQMMMPTPQVSRPLWQNLIFMAAMIGILVFANWGSPNDFFIQTKDGQTLHAAIVQSPEEGAAEAQALYTLKQLDETHSGQILILPAEAIIQKIPAPGPWTTLWKAKWIMTSAFAFLLGAVLIAWFGIKLWKIAFTAAATALPALLLPMEGLMVMIPFSIAVVGLSWAANTTEGEMTDWFGSTWTFAKQILPLLFFGVLVAGALLGRPGHEGLIPSVWVQKAVGGNSIWANLFASVAGAFMYFATLTEVPILQGLLGAGMGKGPALALLLAGPALSLPNMLVIRSIMGTQKTIVFVSLVIVMAAICGMIFGAM